MIGRIGLSAACLLGMLVVNSPTRAAASDGWHLGSDLRTGFYASEREARDGSSTSANDVRARLRLSVQRDLGPRWLLRSRLAGSFSSDGNQVALKLDRNRARPTATDPGEVHFDEFYLRWKPSSNAHQLRIGRFQTGFKLPVVPGKSLDRNDSSNVGIGWTDGFHLESRISTGWHAHLIGQLNHRRGTGNTVRSPLSFTDSASRTGWYLGLQATEDWGPVVMRMVSVHWVPEALASSGLSDPGREDYLTAAAKVAAGWPVGNDQATRLVLAGEFAQAFNRPQRSVLLLAGDGDVGGTGLQLSANLFDVRPGHHVGVVYGRAQGGWLTSNDYRNNDELFEVRYQRRFSPALSMEIRARRRQELEPRIESGRLQRDYDIYARLTWRILRKQSL